MAEKSEEDPRPGRPEPKPEPKPEKQSGVSVVYRGPHAQVLLDGKELVAHGQPVDMTPERLAGVRAALPGHFFDEVA